jgi:hypothetical protein
MRAEQVLLALPQKPVPGEVMRAKELAAQYRWQATKRNPRVYADKQEITVTTPVSDLSDNDLNKAIEQKMALLGMATPKPAEDKPGDKVH